MKAKKALKFTNVWTLKDLFDVVENATHEGMPPTATIRLSPSGNVVEVSVNGER